MGGVMDGLQVKIARIRVGLTLWDVGQLVGLHAARISEMERGQRPISDTVVKALEKKLAEASRVGS